MSAGGNATYNQLMDIGYVQDRGKRIEEIGQEIQTIVSNYNQTVLNMLGGAILGATNIKLLNVDETIQPGMTKQGQATESAGRAVGKAAVDTDQMDQNVANSMHVMDQKM